MKFEVGQIFFFVGHHPEAASWCSRNNCNIVRDGQSGWRIEAIPTPTDGEAKAAKIAELRAALMDADWRSMREHDRKAANPDHAMAQNVFTYKQFLRDFDGQEGLWRETGVHTFEEYTEQVRKENDTL
jgi:hypothetical protein